MENFALVHSANVVPLLMEIERNDDLFGQLPVRTNYEGSAHREITDVILRGPVARNGDDTTLAELQDEVFCQDYTPSQVFPEVMGFAHQLMYALRATMLGRVLITRLPPGGKIYPHADEGTAADFYSRYHLCVTGDEGNQFTSGDETVDMLTGQVWYVNNHINHHVENNTEIDRIHVIVDVRIEP